MKFNFYVNKLPKKCGDCPLCEVFTWCNLLDGEPVDYMKKLPNCPLKEIRELMNEKNN